MRKLPNLSWSLVGLAFFAIGALKAQQTAAQPALGGSAGVSELGPARGTNAANPGPARIRRLETNMTLTVKGSYLAGLPIDLAWTGLGAPFQSTVRVKTDDGDVQMRGQADVQIVDGGYQVQLTLTASIPMGVTTTTPNGTVVKQIGYKQAGVVLAGVLLKPGQPMEVFSRNGQTLTLTLTAPDGK